MNYKGEEEKKTGSKRVCLERILRDIGRLGILRGFPLGSGNGETRWNGIESRKTLLEC